MTYNVTGINFDNRVWKPKKQTAMTSNELAELLMQSTHLDASIELLEQFKREAQSEAVDELVKKIELITQPTKKYRTTLGVLAEQVKK